MEGEIKVGDDVTVCGKVTDIEDGSFIMRLPSGVPVIAYIEDIKTHRPKEAQDGQEMP